MVREEDVGNELLLCVHTTSTSKELYRAVFKALQAQIIDPALEERIRKCFSLLNNGALPVFSENEYKNSKNNEDEDSSDSATDDEDSPDRDDDDGDDDDDVERKQTGRGRGAEKSTGAYCVVPFAILVKYESRSYYYSYNNPSYTKTLYFNNNPAFEFPDNMKFTVSIMWNPNEENEEMLHKPFSNIDEYPPYPSLTRAPHSESKEITLEGCLQSFGEATTLGEEDMWYCSTCKEHRQASVRTSLWRAPKILVIALKRFIYNGSVRSKIETLVKYQETLTVHDAVLGADVQYKLYAVSV
jgi:hypothetical protein